MGALKRWQEYVRQYGTAGLVRYLLARVVRPVWERSSAQLLVMTAPTQPQAVKAKVPIEVVRLTAPRTGLEVGGLDWADRWARGEVCYSAWLDGACVHYSWVSRQDSYLAEVHESLQIGPDEAYIYDCFTDGRHRGQAIFPAVLSTLASDLFGQGVQRIWIAVEEENRSSTRAILRAGFVPAAELHYRRLLVWASKKRLA